MHGYSRLTKRELAQLLQRVEPIDLLQREEEPMDIDLPPDWLKYDEYADSEFLVHFSSIGDDEYWKHRLQLKFGCHQLNVYDGTFKQQFIKTLMWLKLQFDKFKKKYLTISNEYHGNENCLRIKNSSKRTWFVWIF